MLLRGGVRILGRELGKQAIQRKRTHVCVQRSGIESGNIEQRVEQAIHHADGFRQVGDHGLQLRSFHAPLQGRGEQTDGVERLAQVVARGGDEAGLRLGCLFRRVLLHHERAGCAVNARFELARIGLQTFRHAIETLGQRAQLSAAGGGDRRHAMAVTEFHHRLGQAANRTYHGVADQQGQRDRDGEAGKSQRKPREQHAPLLCCG